MSVQRSFLSFPDTKTSEPLHRLPAAKEAGWPYNFTLKLSTYLTTSPSLLRRYSLTMMMIDAIVWLDFPIDTFGFSAKRPISST